MNRRGSLRFFCLNQRLESPYLIVMSTQGGFVLSHKSVVLPSWFRNAEKAHHQGQDDKNHSADKVIGAIFLGRLDRWTQCSDIVDDDVCS